MPREHYAVTPPNRMARERTRQDLAAASETEQTVRSPKALSIDKLRTAPDVFQPRFDSIAFAPGRTEGHVKELARIVKQGQPLDPITVATFGGEWYVLDGHHRLAAYRQSNWTGPVPVDVRTSDKTGMERVDWAVGLSIDDNKKRKLATSPSDNADAAWLAIAHGDSRSKAELVRAFSVSEGTIAAMRRTAKALREHEVDPVTAMDWRGAKMRLKEATGADSEGSGGDWEERVRRQLAKGLKPVMDGRPSPAILAEALEAYEPGIVAQMAAAMTIDSYQREELAAVLDGDD